MTTPAPSQVTVSPLELALADSLELPDEVSLDPLWTQAFDAVGQLVLRPAKRVRPMLVLAGYKAAGAGEPTDGVLRFAAAQELLHAFMLVHDDVADRAVTRRGQPALHHELSRDPRLGEQLAIVAGDHLFALSIERMLTSGASRAADATRYLLGICRHTAVGQYLDLSHAGTPLSELTLWDTMRVAHLKTARYGFVAPLVCGAMLAGAPEPMIEALARAGRHAGLAFQLRDDLIGLFGDDSVAGKAGDGDYFEGKRTFPVIAAWTRADASAREELERLWDLGVKTHVHCEAARELVRRFGGDRATQRLVERTTRAALKSLASLPASSARTQLEALVSKLAHRGN